MKHTRRFINAVSAFAIGASLSACGSSGIDEVVDNNKSRSVTDIFTFQMPDIVISQATENFLIMDELDRDYYVLKGEKPSLLAEQNPEVIHDYLESRVTASPSEKREILRVLQIIANKPEGRDILERISNKFDRIVIGYDERELGHAAVLRGDGESPIKLLSLGGKKMAYYCDNRSGGVEQESSLVRIVYHELYHFAHHLSDNKPIGGHIDIDLENETVKATDDFMMKYFDMCHRKDYSNGFLL